MILCVDVGNTNIHWGVFEQENLRCTWRTATIREKTGDELGLECLHFLEWFQIDKNKISAIAVASVVPPLNFSFHEMGGKTFGCKPFFAGELLPIPMPILTKDPKEVGEDLLVEAYQGLKKHGSPLIVVDFGTATTFAAISKNGEFLGTAIAPGIAISAEALFAKAAKLPRIKIEKPPLVIGDNTVHSMQSGFLYGFVGQVEKIIGMMKLQLGSTTKVVATGGLAELIAKETKEISIVDENLILEGLRELYYAKATVS